MITITSTLLILPDDIRVKIFGYLPPEVQICLELISTHTDINREIYRILNPYKCSHTHLLYSRMETSVALMYSIYGIPLSRLIKDSIASGIMNLNETNLRAIISQDNCLKCRQCVVYVIYLLIVYSLHYGGSYDSMILYQILYYKINISDIFNISTSRCVNQSELRSINNVYMIMECYIDSRADLLNILISNYNDLRHSKDNVDSIAIGDYQSYISLSEYLKVYLDVLQGLRGLMGASNQELCWKLYMIVKTQSDRLEYKLIWPELSIASNSITIDLISRNYAKNLLHHLKLQNQNTYPLVCIVVEYLIKTRPQIIFNNSITSYVNRNTRIKGEHYARLFSRICEAYCAFINE